MDRWRSFTAHHIKAKAKVVFKQQTNVENIYEQIKWVLSANGKKLMEMVDNCEINTVGFRFWHAPPVALVWTALFVLFVFENFPEITELASTFLCFPTEWKAHLSFLVVAFGTTCRHNTLIFRNYVILVLTCSNAVNWVAEKWHHRHEVTHVPMSSRWHRWMSC